MGGVVGSWCVRYTPIEFDFLCLLVCQSSVGKFEFCLWHRVTRERREGAEGIRDG